MSNDDFDNRLLRALRSSPWSDAGDDLASRAVALATAREQAAAASQLRLASHRRRTALLNLAAVVVIAVIAAGVLSRMSWRDWLAAPDAMLVAEEADMTEPVGLPDEAALLLICGGLLLAALVFVAVNPPERSALPARNWAT